MEKMFFRELFSNTAALRECDQRNDAQYELCQVAPLLCCGQLSFVWKLLHLTSDLSYKCHTKDIHSQPFEPKNVDVPVMRIWE
jgi:hypothetical protein